MNAVEPKTDVVVQLTGIDSNTLSLCSAVTRELKANGYRDLAKEVQNRVFKQESQDDAIQMFMEYVHVE